MNPINRIWLCEPKCALTDRRIKRAFVNELNRIEDYLQEIEESFNKCLFGDNDYEYDRIYQLHLKWWNDSVNYMKKSFKLKYSVIKEHYFEQLYKPNL